MVWNSTLCESTKQKERLLGRTHLADEEMKTPHPRYAIWGVNIGTDRLTLFLGAAFDPKEHCSVAPVSVNDPALDRTIARGLRLDLRRDSRVLRETDVKIWGLARATRSEDQSLHVLEGTMAKKIIGIDLGTTYSCVALAHEHCKPAVLTNDDGDLTTPSVVWFQDENHSQVGKVAKQCAKIYPDRVMAGVERDICNHVVYDIAEKQYKPEMVSSLILRKLVADACQSIGEEIKDVVVTCPAYFGINQREATKNAAVLAGLEARHFLNEPKAAAVCYGIHDGDEIVLVYDLGGGTFDTTITELNDGSISVLYTASGHRPYGGATSDRPDSRLTPIKDPTTDAAAFRVVRGLHDFRQVYDRPFVHAGVTAKNACLGARSFASVGMKETVERGLGCCLSDDTLDAIKTPVADGATSRNAGFILSGTSHSRFWNDGTSERGVVQVFVVGVRKTVLPYQPSTRTSTGLAFPSMSLRGSGTLDRGFSAGCDIHYNDHWFSAAVPTPSAQASIQRRLCTPG